MRYDVWYMRSDWFPKGIMGIRPDPLHLGNTHTFLKSIEANELEDVFCKMQGENWSPNGEARSLIQQAGLGHTSMSVGDVAVDRNTGKAWMVGMIGFAELGQIN